MLTDKIDELEKKVETLEREKTLLIEALKEVKLLPEASETVKKVFKEVTYFEP